MSTTPAAPGARAGGPRRLYLSQLLRVPVTDRGGEHIGRLSDLIARLRGADRPGLTGLVVHVGGRPVFVAIEQVSALDDSELRLTSAKLDLRKFERREGEVLLRADVLGHRLLDVPSAQLLKAVDLELAQQDGEWVIIGVDSRRQAHWLFGHRSAEPRQRAFHEWSRFEPLIGHMGSVGLRHPLGRIRRLKPAQIADLLESASKAEEREILGQVHADPELEADVFEELDEDLASRLLGARTDAEIASVLARMRADDSADAISGLPQVRRKPVLDLLPPAVRTKVLTLMGFNPTSAGGLMGVDFVTVPADAGVAAAVAAVASAGNFEPQAITSVHAVDDDGRLCGVARLVTLVQAAPDVPLTEVYDDDPVRVGP